MVQSRAHIWLTDASCSCVRATALKLNIEAMPKGTHDRLVGQFGMPEAFLYVMLRRFGVGDPITASQ